MAETEEKREHGHLSEDGVHVQQMKGVSTMKKLYKVTLFDGFEAEAKGRPNFRMICIEAEDVATEIWLNPNLSGEPYEVEEVTVGFQQ